MELQIKRNIVVGYRNGQKQAAAYLSVIVISYVVNMSGEK